MSKERKRFETWFTKSGMLRVANIEGNSIGHREPDGRYAIDAVESAWQAWKEMKSQFKTRAYVVKHAMSAECLSHVPVEGAGVCTPLYRRKSSK